MFFRKGRPAASMSMAMAKGSAAFTRSSFSRMVSRFQGLMVGTPQPPLFGDGLRRALHHGGVGAVAGEGGDAGLGAGGHQDVVIGQVVVLVAVVERHGAHRGGEHRQVQRPAEEVEGGVHRRVFADGVHVDAQLLPLLIVADKAGADALGAGAGDGVLAGQAVAHRTGLAVEAHGAPGLFQNFLIGHVVSPPNRFPKAAVRRGRWFDCTPVGRKRQPLAEKFLRPHLRVAAWDLICYHQDRDICPRMGAFAGTGLLPPLRQKNFPFRCSAGRRFPSIRAKTLIWKRGMKRRALE